MGKEFNNKAKALEAFQAKKLDEHEEFMLLGRPSDIFCIHGFSYGGEQTHVVVSVIKNRYIIELDDALNLAYDAGMHSFQSGVYMVVEEVKNKEKDGRRWQEKVSRYLAKCSVTDKEGRIWTRDGSAGADNVFDDRYAAEMANKRALVRTIIFALGLRGINADVEFPN